MGMKQPICRRCGYGMTTLDAGEPACRSCGPQGNSECNCRLCRLSLAAPALLLGLIATGWLLWPASGNSTDPGPVSLRAPAPESLRSADVELRKPPQKLPHQSLK